VTGDALAGFTSMKTSTPLPREASSFPPAPLEDIMLLRRLRLPALLAGLAFLATGCSSEPTAPDDRAAADAAQTLLHLADSLSANGGSTNEVGAYRGLAALLQGTGRLSSVSNSVDGTATQFLATAQEITFGCPPEMLCGVATTQALPPDRLVSAWQQDNPRRMVQLFVPGHTYPTVAPDTGGMPFAAVTDLLFLDGNGAMYGGTTTTRSISVTLSDTPCVTPDVFRPAVYPTWPCRQAEFTVAFDGVATFIPIVDPVAMPFDSLGTGTPTTSNASATPSHRVTMAQQQVHGAHVDADIGGICVDNCPTPPGATPPMTPPSPDSLTASLAASVGSDVTFTFTVTNAGTTAADVKFNDGQQYDIRVWDANDTLVWRWGADKVFIAALTSRTIAAGESVTYVEHWTPPAAGKYRAMAYLTSSSHAAAGFTDVTVP
jgi:hypothetical protein